MGKTTVIRSFLGRLGRDVTRFSCTAQSELTVPFLPLASLFDGLGIVRRQRLPQATELEPEVDLELFGEVAGAILTTARERTVVLALDDVQWVDDATSRLLSFVSASLADHAIDAAVRVLAILTARRSISGAPASFFDRMTGGPDGRLITLEPLDETSVAELVGRRTGRRLSPSDARSMAEATGGNPLLIELVAGQDRAAGAPLRLPTSMSDEIERKLRPSPTAFATCSRWAPCRAIRSMCAPSGRSSAVPTSTTPWPSLRTPASSSPRPAGWGSGTLSWRGTCGCRWTAAAGLSCTPPSPSPPTPTTRAPTPT